MTDNEIMDLIFEQGRTLFTEEENAFWNKLSKERKKRGYPWKTGDPFDFIAIGIYIGIKQAAEENHMRNIELIGISGESTGPAGGFNLTATIKIEHEEYSLFFPHGVDNVEKCLCFADFELRKYGRKKFPRLEVQKIISHEELFFIEQTIINQLFFSEQPKMTENNRVEEIAKEYLRKAILDVEALIDANVGIGENEKTGIKKACSRLTHDIFISHLQSTGSITIDLDEENTDG